MSASNGHSSLNVSSSPGPSLVSMRLKPRAAREDLVSMKSRRVHLALRKDGTSPSQRGRGWSRRRSLMSTTSSMSNRLCW